MEGLVSSDFHPPNAFLLPGRPDPGTHHYNRPAGDDVAA